MFGKRSMTSGAAATVSPLQPAAGVATSRAAEPAAAAIPAPTAAPPPAAASKPAAQHSAPVDNRRSDEYYQTKSMIFGALIEAIDLSQLAKLDGESAREEIRDIVNEIIALKN